MASEQSVRAVMSDWHHRQINEVVALQRLQSIARAAIRGRDEWRARAEAAEAEAERLKGIAAKVAARLDRLADGEHCGGWDGGYSSGRADACRAAANEIEDEFEVEGGQTDGE